MQAAIMLAALNFSIGEEVQDCGSFMNHDSASNAEELTLGKMSHEDNTVATQELALGKMSNEDNIVATQKLAMSGDMLNKDMESLAGLNQSLTVFVASGNKSTCGSQESTAYIMEIGSGQDHALTMIHDSATDYGYAPDAVWNTPDAV